MNLLSCGTGLGHLGIQFVRRMGYRTVALSSSGAKQSLAMSLGAHDYIDGSKENQAEALQKMGGAKVVLCTAPSADVIQELLPCFAPGGIMLLIAGPSLSLQNIKDNSLRF